MYVMPYSIRRETVNSLKIYESFNSDYIDLIKNQLHNDKLVSKAGLLVSCNVLDNHIRMKNETLNDNKIREICDIQNRLSTMCDFLLNFIQHTKISKRVYDEMNDILEGNSIDEGNNLGFDDKLCLDLVKYINILNDESKKLLNGLEE